MVAAAALLFGGITSAAMLAGNDAGNHGHSGVEGCDRRSPEEALCGGKEGSPNQFPAAFVPEAAFDKCLRKQMRLPV
jgi:hypothetical protein